MAEDRTALIVVDVQRAFEDGEFWGARNNPDCDANVGALIEHWRAAGRPLVYVRHDSDEDDSPLRPDRPGNAFKDVVTGEPDLLVTKQVNSAFYGSPDLHEWLRSSGIDDLVICGITTNHCCETTARMADNLGYRVRFVVDATHTFDMAGPDGQMVSADDLTRATAASLHGEFADVVRTGDVV